jgi:hypothetical protein
VSTFFGISIVKRFNSFTTKIFYHIIVTGYKRKRSKNMNIQIFGKSKCFDTKKAERWFKERRIKYQLIDVAKYGMSRGEYA